jgi:hypothetical protein
VAALVGSVAVLTRDTKASAITRTQETVPASGSGDEVRILAGSSVRRYVDRHGNIWLGDQYYKDGDAMSIAPKHIGRTLDAAMYLSRREGDFQYDIPLRPGVYELRLYFAETVFGEENIAGGGETSRLFSVTANGRNLLFGHDVIADAGGPNLANIKVFKDVTPGEDGYLHVRFFPTYFKERAFVNAIEVVPGIPGRMRPIRILARSTSYTDRDNDEWSSDRFVSGGQQIVRYDRIGGTEDQILYQSERFGHFAYTVPVVDGGRYTVTLRFCENWFGQGRTGGGGAGSRLFDVYCNGRTLLKNFDVLKEAGGPLRPIDRVFKGLEPTAQGKLTLRFVPVVNYALINAIEVVDEGR